MHHIGPRPLWHATGRSAEHDEAAFAGGAERDRGPAGSGAPAREQRTAAGARLLRILLVGLLPGTRGCAPALPERPPALAASPAPVAEPPSAPRDGDGDGFVDGRDACPDVAGVAPDGCPEPDRDGDGFVERVDTCPDEPGVEPDGCPIPDSDFDGILDPDDTCPRTPETHNGYVDSDGCPDEIPEDLARVTGVIRGISFELDRDTLRPAARAVLDRAAAVLRKHPSIRLEISGHVDSTGSTEYCRDLSSRRARSVKQYLIEQGIDETRLESRGAGPSEPIDTNKTARGRARNRRIEFTILVH